jgi:para-aminobenzoate synthetase component 1
VASAWWSGRLASDLVDVADLAERPDALDHGGWWAVRADFEGRVRVWRFATVRAAPLPASGPYHGPDPGAWTSSMTRDQYVAGVETIRELVREGEVYQVNLCRVLSAHMPGTLATSRTQGLDPWALAAVLARGNPAPYAGVLDTHDGWVVSASPELFLSRDGEVIESGPIKGTARTPEGLTDKDVAENLMITDLVRNDLQRVCAPGTVDVTSLLRMEQHPGLVHLVSTIRGRLRPGTGWADVLAATFPPGSVSGAPKWTALKAISSLEPAPRGPYCGGLGFVDADAGTAVLAVGIRSFWAEEEGSDVVLRFGTGAGITWGSDPAQEWRETELKAERLVALASTAAASGTIWA